MSSIAYNRTRYENMLAFLGALDIEYGGAEGYATRIGFSGRDVEKIKTNLKAISAGDMI